MPSTPQQSLETILAELESLKSAKILSDQDFTSHHEFFNKTLTKVKEDQAKAESRIFVEAKYEFTGTEANDLSLKPNMRIQVLEKLNADWWRGQAVESGAVGIFPSNYVEVVDSKSTQAINSLDEKAAVKKTGYYGKKSDSDSKPFDPKSEYSPPPNYQLQANNQQNYQQPPNNQNYQQPVQYQQEYQQPVIVEQQQPERRHHPVLQRFGEAAIFGAGAAVGADIVNHIF